LLMTKKFKNLLIRSALVLLLTPLTGMAQDSTFISKHPAINEIWKIPHKTAWQLWMWPHRTFVMEITKERPVNYDTAYIRSFQRKLVVTLPVSTRFLQFTLVDFKSGNKLNFAPNLEYDLGISISSRWSCFIVNSGVKLFNNGIDTRGETKCKDYQLNLYGRKFTTDIFVQSYKGFYIKNSRSYESYNGEKPFEIRSDIQAINLGVSSYYIFNHKRFSYKNSFTFVEQQKKSAGSLLFGIYYTYFEAKGDPSLVTDPFRSNFDTLSFINRGHVNNFGLNLGYIYTLVFLKKCYATVSLVQGIGGVQMQYQRDDNSTYHQLIGAAGKLNARVAVGYDQGKYFVGTMGMIDYFLFRKRSNSTFDYSFGKAMLFVGYRFSILKKESKMLKRLKLIGY
jgi:hypothetical protein